jgi:hypothetical protein
MPDENTPGTGGTTDTGAGGGNPGASAGAGAAGAGAAGSTTNDGTGGQAGAAGGAATRTGASNTGFTYTEDRSKWIPPHRLNEETQKHTQLKAQFDDLDRRFKLAIGGTPADEKTQKSEAVKEAFFQMFPAAKRLFSLPDDQLERLLQTPDAVAQTTAAEQRQWERHGNQALTYIGDRIADALHLEKLDTDAVEDIRPVFSRWLKSEIQKELQTSNGEKSDTLRRYEDSDQSLFDAFATHYTKRWVDPARRSSAAQTTNRTRPVPDSRGRNAVASSVARPDKFNSLDERIEYAAKLAKERGVQFGQ